MPYIGAPITVAFDRPPLYSKRPHCPDRFTWDGETFVVEDVLGQNVDFGRRGRMAQNMQPEHAAHAALHGSWGVGRYSFRVRRPRPQGHRPPRGPVVPAGGGGGRRRSAATSAGLNW